MDDFWHPGSHSWLDLLDDESRGKLRAASLVSRYGPGDTIFTPTKEPSSVYLLEEGLVRIFRLSESGDETSFGYIADGQVFGELTIFGGRERESFAQAIRPSVVWRIPRTVFQRILESDADLVIEVTHQMGHRMRRIENRVENLVFRPVRARLAHILLELANDFGAPAESGVGIDVPLTQAELATLIGTTRQSVNACLGELQQRGLIGRSRGTIVVQDAQALAREVSAR